MFREKCLLIFLLLISPAWGNEKQIPGREYEFQEDSKDEIPVSKKYRAGLFFVYDCRDRHYACVDRDSFDKCKQDRAAALKVPIEKLLPCAPMKHFNTRVECHKAQYKHQDHGGNLAICQNPKIE